MYSAREVFDFGRAADPMATASKRRFFFRSVSFFACCCAKADSLTAVRGFLLEQCEAAAAPRATSSRRRRIQLFSDPGLVRSCGNRTPASRSPTHTAPLTKRDKLKKVREQVRLGEVPPLGAPMTAARTAGCSKPLPPYFLRSSAQLLHILLGNIRLKASKEELHILRHLGG